MQKPLIVMALESEGQRLLEKLGYEVLYCGVGKVNAAHNLARHLTQSVHNYSWVLNLGSAGSHTFKSGSLVAADRFVQRDMDVTGLGFELGCTPFEDGPATITFPLYFKHLQHGVCGSGDSFLQGPPPIPSDIIDMEAYALAKVCQHENIPFVCVKYITDGADGVAHKDWQENLQHAAQAFVELLRKLPSSKREVISPKAIKEITEAGRLLDANGWAPATSGNYSMRVGEDTCAITVSGRHKGQLNEADIMAVDMQGRPLDHRVPSAETLLHTLIYRLHPNAKAVLHMHSAISVVLGRIICGTHILSLHNYEILKAFPGITTHNTTVNIPIFENTQDIPALAKQVEHIFKSKSNAPAFLIRNHGTYVWGKDMQEALRIAQAVEFLFQCELLQYQSVQYAPAQRIPA